VIRTCWPSPHAAGSRNGVLRELYDAGSYCTPDSSCCARSCTCAGSSSEVVSLERKVRIPILELVMLLGFYSQRSAVDFDLLGALGADNAIGSLRDDRASCIMDADHVAIAQSSRRLSSTKQTHWRWTRECYGGTFDE
jgi:hypothetical protein